ncbi:IS30 family transposase [Kaistia sp. 32K]|uniref:IS30 family transposase n=1 Tax=Kaistia sp. 32K TaxID=2795690 RepID=UPI0019156DF4|nr:IS30 family transposase [Kaistia sp. 32K]BCP52656.1 IS30 family transposase [Kaistia sp. 32K]
MGREYSQLGLEERIEIARLSGEGASIRQIAAALDRAPSSIARELKRNRGQQVGYQPAHAEAQARARRWNGSRLDRDPALRTEVLGQLRAGWSPEQIAGRLRRDGPSRLSHESIYRFVYAQIRRHNDFTWRNYLPKAKSRRGWRPGKGGSPALHMRHRVPLAERPGAVLTRLDPGHWEADLMAFSRYGQNLLLLHDRMSRVLIGSPLPSKRAEPVAGALAAALQTLPPACRKTVTFDNGTEFARHYELGALGIATYFCDPHAPWQKGGIENAIGRMRRFLPRKTDLAALDSGALIGMMAAYNNTPRKCLGFKTPAEAFSEQVLHFGCESTSPPSRG